ncbi:hypothetical protein BJ138DRAFT_1107003 [Hygrophoropsis aurantiaca]|uniref:Uncharacterized protein n=1 Tax=Hygrophoropsis aurantiaca TaxID=72124 RepID=A0ACB7ZTQ9_9AGAM|nr:hypothetical protein BJ138DRAFT_1107003 [Hygrophoropsis aurantiaca]
MVALKSAILITLASIIPFAAAKCDHSTNPFETTVAIYDLEDCITHGKDDHFIFHENALKWDNDGCKCLDFASNFRHAARSIVFTPRRRQKISMHLVRNENCKFPEEDEYDEQAFVQQPHIYQKLKPGLYKSAWVCKADPGGPGRPSRRPGDDVVKYLVHDGVKEAIDKLLKDTLGGLANDAGELTAGEILEGVGIGLLAA